MTKEEAKEYISDMIEMSKDYFDLYEGTGIQEKTEKLLLELVDTIPAQSQKTYTVIAMFATRNLANGIDVGEKIRKV